MENPRNEAVELLCHYFEQVGLAITDDVEDEMLKIVNAIIDAARLNPRK